MGPLRGVKPREYAPKYLPHMNLRSLDGRARSYAANVTAASRTA